jgi:hypothetical protein
MDVFIITAIFDVTLSPLCLLSFTRDSVSTSAYGMSCSSHIVLSSSLSPRHREGVNVTCLGGE